MGKLQDFVKQEEKQEKDMDFSTLTDGKALRAKSNDFDSRAVKKYIFCASAEILRKILEF